MPIGDLFGVFRAMSHYPLRARVRWIRSLAGWCSAVRRDVLPSAVLPPATAVILSYRRPQNIRLLVRSLLRVPSVSRIVVSNNDAASRLPVRLGLRDPKITVLNQPIDCSTLKRMHIARSDPAERFIFIDDDLFLLPSTIHHLLASLDREPMVPHGLIGEVYDTWMGRMHRHVTDHAGPVDILNGVYALTKDHLRGFFAIVDLLGLRPEHPAMRSSAWDDIVLSHSGDGRPVLHRCGPILSCPTSEQPSIAVSSGADFFRERQIFLCRLRSALAAAPLPQLTVS